MSSLFSPSSGVPAHRYLLTKLSFSLYLPKSAVHLMCGLKSTSSSSQINLKRYPLYFLFHMHLSGSTRWDFLRWYFLQWGHVFFFGLMSLTFSFFFFLRVLDVQVVQRWVRVLIYLLVGRIPAKATKHLKSHLVTRFLIGNEKRETRMARH